MSNPKTGKSNATSSKKQSLNTVILQRFILIFVSIIILVVLLVLSISNISQTKEVVADYNVKRATLSKISESHFSWVADLSTSLAAGTQFTGTTDANSCSLGSFISANSNDPFYSNMISDITAKHQEMHQQAAVINAMSDSQYNEKVNIFLSVIKPNTTYVVSVLDNQMSNIDAAITSAEASLDSTMNFVYVCITVSVLLVLGASFLTLSYISKKIVAPLTRIETETKKMSEGNLALNLNFEADSRELDQLRLALLTSATELRRILGAIELHVGHYAKRNFSMYPEMTFPGEFIAIEKSMANLVDAIRGTMGEIMVSADQVTSGSEQVSSGSQILANGAMEQTDSVHVLSSTIETVSQKVIENGENAKYANELGKTAVEVVEQSTKEMEELMLAIAEIQQSSFDIEKIIQTIDGIAFQTNILALNAAVEAAKAGQAGKGFAVVADEVRNLAQKSADAARNTTALIETSLSAVRRGSKLATHANSTFEEVVVNTKQVLDIVAKIADASDEQASSITDISDSVDKISDVVQNNTNTSKESAAASEELSSQASVMKSLISGFELGEQ